MLLSVHQKLLDNFFRQKSKNILHHAFIFRVKDALLLDDFIVSLCELLLDQKVDDYIDSPYTTIASPENDEIRVAQIKKITKICHLTAHNKLAKIIIIKQLELLNESAANALLKTLEEPTKDTFFLMFTNSYSDIPTTVRSRSVRYDIKFSQQDKCDYLKYNFNMSKEAIEKSFQMTRGDINVIVKIKLEHYFWNLRNSLMKVLVNQQNLGIFLRENIVYFRDVLYWLTSIIIDAYYYKIDNQSQSIANYDRLIVIKYLVDKFGQERIHELYRRALEAENYFANFKNVDKELILENLILAIIS